MRRILTIVFLVLVACSAARATDITVGSIQTHASYRTTGNTATVRWYSNDTFTDSNGKLVFVGTPGSTGFYQISSCTISNNVLTCASTILPSTTNSSRPTATFTAIVYSSTGAQLATLFSRWRIPHTLGSSITFVQLEGYQPTAHPPLGDSYYTKDGVNALLASAVSGSGAPKMNDATFGIGRLYEPASDITAPILAGINSIFVNSVRTQARASLPASSVKTGTQTKLTDAFRGWMYDNGTSFTRANLGVYNVLDFQAKDDNSTDARAAIQSAIDTAEAAGGGVVRLSYSNTGTYRISAPIVYKNKVVIEGEVNSLGAIARLQLTSSNTNAITVGENLVNVHIRNLGIYTTGTTNTKGILITGQNSVGVTQGITLENLAIDGFTRGISVEATDVGKEWQASYAIADNLLLHNVAYGIYLDSLNSDWTIRTSKIFATVGGYGIYCENCGPLLIEHNMFAGATGSPLCTAGIPNAAMSEAAIFLENGYGAIYASQNEAEGFRETLIADAAGPVSPITFISNIMGAPIELRAAVQFNATGNAFYDDTVQAGVGSKVYMQGNAIDSRNTCLDAGTGLGGVELLDPSASVVSRNAIDGTDFGRPVSIGSVRPDNTDPGTAAVPWLQIGRPVANQILMRLGKTDAAGAFTFYYDVKRNDTTGFLDFYGSQAIPNRGISVNGVVELFGTSSAGTALSGKAVINHNATADKLGFSVNTRAFAYFLGITTTPTVNRLLKVTTATNNPILGDSLFMDNGTNAQIVSGGLTFGGFTSSEAGFFRSGTTLKARLADNSADAPFTAGASVFASITTTAANGGGTLAEQLLSTTSAVDMNTATATTLYTCPSGKSCAITKVMVTAASTSLTTASYSFGWNSASFNDVIANATHTELTGSTLYTVLNAKIGATLGGSSGTFKVLMNTLQGGAATTTIRVWGIVY